METVCSGARLPVPSPRWICLCIELWVFDERTEFCFRTRNAKCAYSAHDTTL